jgi:hypothetical protein
MGSGILRLRGELRRLLHPAALAGVLAVAVMAVHMQRAAGIGATSAPSPEDALGALRIGFRQHATLLGFALAGLVAGLLSGDDPSSGLVETWRLSDPRVVRRWCRRVVASVLLLLMSVVVTAVAVAVLANDPPFVPSPSPASSWADVLRDGSSAVVAMAFFASFSAAVAGVVRNALLLAAVNVTLFSFPERLGVTGIRWLFPSKWVSEALFLTEDGYSVDYLGQRSINIHRHSSQVAAGVVALAVAIVLSIALGVRTTE